MSKYRSSLATLRPPRWRARLGSDSLRQAGSWAALAIAIAALSSQPAEAEPIRPTGIPNNWVVGGVYEGRAGESIHGIEVERYMTPAPGLVYISSGFDTRPKRTWNSATPAVNGDTTIITDTRRYPKFGAGGGGYAVLYFKSPYAQSVVLHHMHNGGGAYGWLDSNFFGFVADPTPPADMPPGTKVKATFNLSAGWHRLTIKMPMNLEPNVRFWFAAKFTYGNNAPVTNLETLTNDPSMDSAALGAFNAAGKYFRPLVYVDGAPGNLPREGEPLRVRVKMNWFPQDSDNVRPPISNITGKVTVHMGGGGRYFGARTSAVVTFPGEVVLDFGTAPAPGFYVLHPILFTSTGKLIATYPQNGFTVVGKNTNGQRARIGAKKLWNCYYYAFGDGDRSFHQTDGLNNWLDRTGIYKNLGSQPGAYGSADIPRWSTAANRGITLVGDTGGDSDWLMDYTVGGVTPQQQAINMANALKPYTRYFKAHNEIDVKDTTKGRWGAVKNPDHYVARARWEWEAFHGARSDAVYLGGSLVKPGVIQWYKDCLVRDLARWVDAWDVHWYPNNTIFYGQQSGNWSGESEQGVIRAHNELGRTNTKRFYLGEGGWYAFYSHDGSLGQAAKVAQLAGWVNGRSNYDAMAYILAHEYAPAYGRQWGHHYGHKPAEAALYTASALMDGMSFRQVTDADRGIQAAWYGEKTFMIWTNGAARNYTITLPAGTWYKVDMLGFKTSVSGTVTLWVTDQPTYLVRTGDYEALVNGVGASQPASGVVDGGFESQPGGSVRPPWALRGYGGIESGRARSGSKSAWLRASSGWNAVQQVITVTPNRNYTLRAYVRTSTNNTDGYFGVRLKSDGPPYAEMKYGRADAYTQISVTFNSGNNTSMEVFCGHWCSSDTWVNIDDISLQ
jgi:hypothetical protein